MGGRGRAIQSSALEEEYLVWRVVPTASVYVGFFGRSILVGSCKLCVGAATVVVNGVPVINRDDVYLSAVGSFGGTHLGPFRAASCKSDL